MAGDLLQPRQYARIVAQAHTNNHTHTQTDTRCSSFFSDVTLHWFAEESDLDDVRGERWFSDLLGRVAERDKKRQARYAVATTEAGKCAVM